MNTIETRRAEEELQDDGEATFLRLNSKEAVDRALALLVPDGPATKGDTPVLMRLSHGCMFEIDNHGAFSMARDVTKSNGGLIVLTPRETHAMFRFWSGIVAHDIVRLAQEAAVTRQIEEIKQREEQPPHVKPYLCIAQSPGLNDVETLRYVPQVRIVGDKLEARIDGNEPGDWEAVTEFHRFTTQQLVMLVVGDQIFLMHEAEFNSQV